jgi:hypothetical protein
MNEDNREEKAAFQEMLNRVHLVLGKPEPDTFVVRLYWDALRPYTLEDVREALSRHLVDVDTGMFIPKPADIVRNIQGNTTTQGEAAWTKLEKTIRCVGPYQTVTFDDPIIHQVLHDMGGWVPMCQVSEDELRFKHIEFVKRYRGYINRAPALSSIPGKMIGLSDQYNMKEGYEAVIEPPILVGNPARAAKLLQQGGTGTPALFHRLDNKSLAQLMNGEKISGALGGPDAAKD